MCNQVSILGSNWGIHESDEIQEPRLIGADGFCDDSVKEIFVDSLEKIDKSCAKKNLESYKKKVLRHEITHAFLCESGLAECSDWATNEEMVDWIARQGLKLYEAWKQAECV